MAGGGKTCGRMTDVLNEVRAERMPYATSIGRWQARRSVRRVRSCFLSALAAAASRRGGLPERIRIGDIAMTGIATHKLTRLSQRTGLPVLGARSSPTRSPADMVKSRKPREAGDCGWRWASCSYVPTAWPSGSSQLLRSLLRRAPVHATDCRHVYRRGCFRLPAARLLGGREARSEPLPVLPFAQTRRRVYPGPASRPTIKR